MSGSLLIFILTSTLLVIILWTRAHLKKRNRTFHARELQRFPNFTPRLVLEGGQKVNGIAIDPEMFSFAVLAPWGVKVLSYEDLVDVEIVKNGSSLTVTDRLSQIGGAAVGGVLLGGAGLLLGGLSGRKHQIEKIHSLSLRLYLRDMDYPVHEVPLFVSEGTLANHPSVTAAARSLTEWHGRLMAILDWKRTIAAYG